MTIIRQLENERERGHPSSKKDSSKNGEDVKEFQMLVGKRTRLESCHPLLFFVRKVERIEHDRPSSVTVRRVCMH
jgi:hypothetical protein